MKNKIFIVSLIMGILIFLTSCEKAQSPTVTPNQSETNTQEQVIIDDTSKTATEESTTQTEESTSEVKTTFPNSTITKEVVPEKEPVTPPVTKIPDTMKNFIITAKQWTFTPGEIVVNKGDTVRLEITSVDVKHGFNIPEYNINKTLVPGEKIVVEFVADKAGTFSFFCNVMCGTGHRDMKGTLIVK